MINITFVIAGNTPGAPTPAIYIDAAKRFVKTYVDFPADYEHRLFLVNSNGGYTPEIADIFRNVPHEVIEYPASGWDIGAHIFAAYLMKPDDWIMCFSSWAHFNRRGWLRAFVDARTKFGDGLYGSTSSFERNPHIRGTGFFVRCERMHRYPHGCNSKEESWEFESGPDSLSQWCLRQGYGAWLVTPDTVVPLEKSRNLPNIYRRGDQSNILTFDKHTDIFERSSEKERKMLSRDAEGYVRRKKLSRRIKSWIRKFLAAPPRQSRAPNA
ncbi:hypothetical protein J3R73_000919 [Labrys monachus]|uniref:Glycosyltransferase n=1 Tax=Labrys monachus TaxID=217067 RepID=A0ABU0F9X0_9HYPH|nr:hypothetical protein [Labrys monachus]